MTAHLYCWHPELNLLPTDRTFLDRIGALYERRQVPPAFQLIAFVEDLLERYPDVTESEDTVWADGPLDGNIIDEFINMSLIWSRYEEAVPFVVATAHKHGLHCYDPQTGDFYPVHHQDREIRSIVIDLLALLADGDYPSIMERCGGSGMTIDELQEIIRDYGRKVIAPPADYACINMYEREATAVPTWAVEADLWTEEEGRSDLTLSMTIAFGPSGPAIRLDNLHVL
jgi:hypothetical protein